MNLHRMKFILIIMHWALLEIYWDPLICPQIKLFLIDLLCIFYRPIGPVGTDFANGSRDRDSIQGPVILQKWYLTLPCFALSIIRYVSRVKLSNPGKGVIPFPTPRCSSYWKRVFGSLTTTVAKFIYIYHHVTLSAWIFLTVSCHTSL